MSSLRNLDEVIENNQESLVMNTGISIENNAVYKSAFNKGEAKNARSTAIKMLQLGKYSDSEILMLLELSQQELDELKKQLS